MLTKIKSFIAGLVEWSTRERPGIPYKDMGGILSRNYRTWMGHSGLAMSSVAVGKLIAMIFAAPISVIIHVVATMGPILFYGNREFGPGGDYYKAKYQPNRKMKQNKRIDSLGDFITPLFFGVFSMFNFSIVVSVIAAAVMIGVMVLLKSMDDG